MKKPSRETTLMIVGTILVMIVPSVCSVVTVGVGMVANDVQTQDLNKAEDPPPIVTLEEFGRTELGMRYREVVDILGASGVEMAPASMPAATSGGAGVTAYVWQNSDFSNMKAVFHDDRLAEKSQLYLR